MAGAEIVIGNLMAWTKGAEKRVEAEMDRHIKASEAFAKSGHPWTDRTGSATAGLEGQTDASATQIISSIGHHVEHGVFLEEASFFDGRYKIIEEARSNNIENLWARIRAVMKMGSIVRG